MRIGITGSNGFIGWHLRCYLKTLENIQEPKLADRTTFSNNNLLNEFVHDLDIIIHLAGVNRANDDELLHGNIHPTKLLVTALKNNNSSVCVIYASSTYAEKPESAYGKGKAESEKALLSWAKHSEGRFINMIIPHVYGEYGRPYYNSAIATFCHQIANNEKISINSNGQLELVHIQDLVEMFIKVIHNSESSNNVRVKGKKISVIDAANRLQALHDEYINHHRLPDLSDNFSRNLFNTLRGAIPHSTRPVSPTKHTDSRGWLIETVKAGSGGQCFVSTTKSGVTRGNHFHRRKVERFFLLQGKGRIQLRKLFTNNIITYDLDGSTPTYVDIPTLHTHSITNIGEDELITLFWTDEFYSPDNPDTFKENI